MASASRPRRNWRPNSRRVKSLTPDTSAGGFPFPRAARPVTLAADPVASSRRLPMSRSLALLAVLALGVVGCSKGAPQPEPAPAANLDKGEREPITLDVNEHGNVLLGQGRTFDSPEKLREFLLLQA